MSIFASHIINLMHVSFMLPKSGATLCLRFTFACVYKTWQKSINVA